MKRRALSTIVGAVFFVIVMASTISYVAYSMNLIDDLARSVDTKQDENLNRQNEEFEIQSVKIDSNNKFNVTLYNKGNIPIDITRLYVENTTDANWNVTKYNITTQIAPGEIQSNIGPNLSLMYIDTESYLLNFITGRGNSESVSVNSGGGQFIHTNLYALPDAVPMGFNTVLLYEVVNNSTGQLVNITPTIDIDTVCTGCIPTPNGNWQPSSYPSLQPGEVATFQRSYTLDGEDGDIFFFNASLTNAYAGVWDEERVDLVEVLQAAEAGVSITAQGIGAAGSDPLKLTLHEETNDTPSGAYQWSNTGADGGNDGLVIKLDVVGEKGDWFTNNGTQAIAIGDSNPWVAALRYQSDLVPSSLSSNIPDLIFFFEGENYPSSIDNSEGSSSRDLRPGTSGNCNGNVPGTTTGKHGTSGYDFDSSNNECFESTNTVSSGDENNIGQGDDSTAFWFKTNGAMSGSDQYFVNFEEDGSKPEYYRVYLTDPGYIEFEYKTRDAGSQIVTCTSTNEYDDSTWHYVVAVRSEPGNDATCELFIDMHTGSSESILSNGYGNYDNTISTEGRWTVGTNKAQTDNFFDGQMDVLMHWDNHRITSTEATELAKTSYGADAHKLGFAIIKTKQDGQPQGQTPFTYTVTDVPFHDTKNGADTNDGSFGFFNYSMAANSVTLDAGQRLNFTIAFENDNSTWVNLPFDLKIDDEDITPYTSFVGLPEEPSNPIPGYLSFNQFDEIEFNFENGGDRGFRYTFSGTRIIFNSTDGSGSYAGIPCAVDGDCQSDNLLKAEQDSVHIPPGHEGYIKFYEVRSVPSHSPPKGVIIPAGVYTGAIWVFGYDDEGLSFEKTFDLGIVTITD